MAFGDNAVTIDWDPGHTAGAADGNLEDFYQTDLIKLDVTAGITYTLCATAFSWAYSPGAVLKIYDAAGNMLQTYQISGDTAVLSYAASSTGAFYASISTYDGAPAPYDFFVSTSGATNVGLYGGDDTYTGAANERILGGDGGDAITLGNATEAFGGQGDDDFIGNDFGDRVAGGDGKDDFDMGAGNDVVWGGAGLDRIWAGAGNDTVYGGDDYDYIYGDLGNDTLHGGNGADHLDGGDGDDILDGGAGADYMEGGNGNNTYYVDNADDQVVGFNGMPEDTVYASVSYALSGGSDVGIMRTTNDNGTQAINFTGDGLDQTLFGNAGANVLDGKGGADTMYGYGGNDWYYVDNGADKVIEAVGGGTADRVFTSINYALAAGAEIELFTTTDNAGTGAINLTGNEFSQTIVGNAGANILDGGKGGNDALYGFDGTDTFLAWSGADTFNGGDGTDTVSFAGWTSGVSINLDLTTAQTVSGGSVTLSSIENITGGNGADTLRGSNGANVLSGGLGNDTFLAWSGADTFNGGDGTDTVSFAGWGSGVSIDLHLTGAQSVSGGSVTLSSIENVIGGNGADTFHAWSGANSFAGGNGSDTISFAGWASGVSINLGLTTAQSVPGGSLVLSSVENAIGGNGNDTFVGTSGANLIAGGNGNDTLTGGGGADTFAFDTAIGAGNVDNITDFSVVDDTIQLAHAIFTGLGINHVLDGAAFVIGAAATNGNQHIIYNAGTGNLYFDDDGNGAHVQQLFAHLSTGLQMTNADFFVA